MRTSIASIVAIASAACSDEPPPPTYTLTFRATSDGEDPIAGASVATEDTVLGQTDSNGILRIQFQGKEGTTIPITVACPDTYDTTDPEITLTLRRVVALGTEQGAAPELRRDIDCVPRQRTSVLIVRARGRAGLPVLVDGEQRAVTDDGGVAHLVFASAPGREVTVQISTADAPRLRPQNPSRTFTLPTEDDILWMDQPFEEQRVRRRRRRPPPGPELPVRLGPTMRF